MSTDDGCGYPSGIVATDDGLGVAVHVDGLTAGEARTLGYQLLTLAEQLTPANPEGLESLRLPLRCINDARGTSYTLEGIADVHGMDLRSMTESDVTVLCNYIGGDLMAATS